MATVLSSGKYQAQGTILSGSEFKDVNLSEASFEDVKLEGSRYSDVNLRSAQFQNVAFDNTTIRDASLRNVIIQDGNYDGMRIDGFLVTELLKKAAQ